MENKLTLEHLAGYLPWKLKVQDKDGNIYEMSPFSGTSYKHNSNEIKYRDVSLCVEFSKPLLYNLSMLTKEIEFDGKKFVPIVELYKISYGFQEYDKIHLVNDWNGRFGFFGVRIVRGSHIYDFNYNSKLQSFKAFTNTNHLELFQKLYEWHFDIHGLIEKGLAIDKTNLK